MLESTVSAGNLKKTRLTRTKLALEKIKRKGQKIENGVDSQQIKDVEDIERRAIELKRKLVEQRVYYWAKELVRGLKKAKSSETQRIVRKLKEARYRILVSA